MRANAIRWANCFAGTAKQNSKRFGRGRSQRGLCTDARLAPGGTAPTGRGLLSNRLEEAFRTGAADSVRPVSLGQ